MSSAMVVMMVGQHGDLEGEALALATALASAGLTLRALVLRREGSISALDKVLGALKGEKGGRCGTERKYRWEMDVYGQTCETCRDAQVKREFARDGY